MKIVVLSCANTGNFGDDIIFEGIKQWLFKINGKNLKTVNHVLRLNDNTIDFVNSHDFLIIGGGEILSNSDILEQIIRNDVTIPYMFFSVGIGSEQDIKPYADRVHPVMWFTRTQKGVAILKNCGIKNAMVHIDPAYLLNPIRGHNGRVAVCLKNVDKDNQFLCDAAAMFDRVINKGIKVDLLALSSVNRHITEYGGERVCFSDCNDLSMAREIASHMDNVINIIPYMVNPIQYMNTMAEYEGIVGERLHSVIVAHNAGIEFRAIAYHDKVNKFLDMTGLKNNQIAATPEAIEKAIIDLWKEIN